MWADEMEDLLRYKGLWDAVANDITGDDMLGDLLDGDIAVIHTAAVFKGLQS